jgi:hypothetical protein
MLWTPILILLLSFIISDQQSPQLKTPGERQADALPRELTETETQKILRENSPKPHVDATLKVSDLRLASALKFVEANEYKSAAQDVDVYADLIVYADAYTRKLPASQIKDRNNCLKKIEQAIFKQTRAIDTVLRQFPVDYREEVGPKIDDMKKIRLRAINDLLGGGRIIKTSDKLDSWRASLCLNLFFATQPDKQAIGWGRMATAAIGQFTISGQDETQLVLFMPVARIRLGDCDAAPEFYITNSGRMPDPDSFRHGSSCP